MCAICSPTAPIRGALVKCLRGSIRRAHSGRAMRATACAMPTQTPTTSPTQVRVPTDPPPVALAHSHTRPTRVHTHTHAHKHTHAHTHTLTHTHTHTHTHTLSLIDLTPFCAGHFWPSDQRRPAKGRASKSSASRIRRHSLCHHQHRRIVCAWWPDEGSAPEMAYSGG